MLLATCPLLTILATSRERLRVEGESTWTVPPLAFPDQGSAAVNEGDYEAVSLFVERARIGGSGFELTEENGRAVAGICRRLDGLPLAIELAAARVGMLSLAEIEERLAADLSLLSGRSRFQPIRHATLTAAVRWSFELLDDDERALFCRLSVFTGRFRLADAEAVCADESLPADRVFDVLVRWGEVTGCGAHRGAIWDAQLDAGDAARFAATVQPARPTMAERHAGHFLALAEEAGRELQGSGSANASIGSRPITTTSEPRSIGWWRTGRSKGPAHGGGLAVVLEDARPRRRRHRPAGPCSGGGG